MHARPDVAGEATAGSRSSPCASLRPSGSRGFQTVVQDLSLSGFSAMAINRLNPGTLCWLTLPGLESQQAKVIWWNNGLVGCAFENLLSPIVHDNLLLKWESAGVPRSTA